MKYWPLLCVVFLGHFARAAETAPLAQTGQILLPGVKGRLDHLALDKACQRLFIAAVDNGSVEILDLTRQRHIGSIPDLREPQGVYYDARSGRLFVACGGDGHVDIYDGTTLQRLASVDLAEDADNIRYDARQAALIVGHAGAKHVFGMKEEGTGALAVLDANGTLKREIRVDAHPESFQLETGGTRLFVNVPENREIEVIDLAHSSAPAKHWSVTAAGDNFPMALDEAHRRLLIATWTPSELLVFDTETGRQSAAVDITGRSDDLFYDARRKRVYLLTDSGVIYVIQQLSADQYSVVARIPTGPGAQTGLFVPELDVLFNAVRASETEPAQVRIFKPM